MICRQADNKSDLEVFWFLQICSKGYCHQIWIHMLLNSDWCTHVFFFPKNFSQVGRVFDELGMRLRNLPSGPLKI